MKNKFSIAMSLAVILAMLVTSLALADNVVNTVIVNVTDTFTAPGSTTVGYRINMAAAGDPQAGCNASDGSPATITLSVPAGVTASATSLTFTACNTTQNVTFSSNTPGDYAITVSNITDSGGGGYNNQANFTLHVLAPPNTPPSVSVTGVTNGATYEAGAVPAAGCSVTDAEDGPSSFAATLSAISGPLAAYGLGSQTASCSYTDSGGLSDSDSVIYSIVDTTNPIITFVSRTPAANGNGWNNGDVTVNWSCSDSGSGVVSASVSQTISTEGENQSTTGTCTDNAGNSASNTQTGINIDKTAPSASASASPAANANGWNNTSVTVSFSGNDGSGSSIDFCDAAVVLSSEGAGQSASGTCTDKAGNVSALATANGINIDKTAPTVSVTGVSNGAVYTLGSVPAAGCSTSDALSGVATNASLSLNGGSVGSVTATCSGALDNAGNTGSASVTYSVIYNWSGFFQPIDNNGVFNVAKSGSTIPVKFSLGGDQGLAILQTGYPKITSVACPTSAPLDTIEELSTGTVSGLRYDALANQYIYNWKTLSTYAGKCYQLSVKLIDGTEHTAFFKFTK